MNGFSSSSTPSSSTPWRAMVSAVYPETKSTLVSGRSTASRSASARPAHARHDDVADHEIDGPAWARATSRAARPSSASRTR